MSKNTVARLVREYAQTGELPISKVRPESGKAQPSVPTSNRKKLKWKEARAQKPASTTVASSSSADRNPHFPLEHSLSHSHSPSLSPPSIITRASSISIPSMASLLPVPARPENPSLVNVSAPTLMGIHEMLINPSSSLFESDAALSNIINPVYDDDTMLSSSKHVPDTNPRL
ncbi:hypothetical protein K7432_005093 [Basidiobolus ranarum]|uniref:Uncharacterized protein n=1 Tax=Basidiobolus ranarum TaxID=34480 RepID=A0ABR2W4J8_9FUNG